MSLLSASKEFRKSVAEASKFAPELNWEADTQLGHKSAEEYRDLAIQLRINMLLKAKSLMQIAPNAVLKDDREYPHYKFYKLMDMDTLIEEIRNNPDDPRFVKSMNSISMKQSTSRVKGDPANIGDYLRFQILSSDISEIIKLRAALLDSRSPVTSYKDQFRRPCTEGGHRAFKFHMEIGDEEKLVIEGQIGHVGLEELQIVKNLRSGERHLKSLFQAASNGGLEVELRQVVVSAMDVAASIMMSARKAVNYNISKKLGLDILLDKDIDPKTAYKEALSELHGLSPQAKRIVGCSPSLSQAGQLLGSEFERQLH